MDGSLDMLVLTACYDGVVRVFEDEAISTGNSVCVSTGAMYSGMGHTGAVKAARFVHQPDFRRKDNEHAFVSGGKDRSVRVWRTAGTGKARVVACTAVGAGHTESVEAVAVVMDGAGKGTKFCSGGWDSRVLVWDVEPEEKDEQSGAKRQKGQAGAKVGEEVQMTSLTALEGHTGAITALAWPHSLAIYSGGYDRTLKQWDTNSASCVHTWNAPCTLTSLAFSTASNVIASGHNDRQVRLWDPRKAGKEIMKMALKSHKGWVTDVSFSAEDPNLLLSASHDNSVKLWDIRSTVPLHTMQAHQDKALSVSWYDGERFVSGGADKQVRVHRLGQRESQQ